jgi:hypothetical protein
MSKARPTYRVFKSAWFTKTAAKAHISDQELCDAIVQVINGQAIDLGGGVFKKRLNRNQHRAIILSKSRNFWVYEYVFAKKDMENISEAELVAFRKLTKAYATLSTDHLIMLLKNRDWTEICQEIRQ